MVNMYKLNSTRLQQEILRFLFIKSGMSFNARVLAKSLEVSQPAISKALPFLKKQEYINVKKDRESKRLSIELNKDNPLIISLKRTENLRMIYESKLAEFLYDNFPGITLILFGSYSKGEDTIHSDIDIAVIGTKEKKIDLTKFSKLLERTIFLHYYKSFKDIHKNLKENLCNGILLKGGIEL